MARIRIISEASEQPSDRDIIDFGTYLDRKHLYYSKQLPKDLIIYAIEAGKDDAGFYIYQRLDDEAKKLAIERSKHIVGLYTYQQLNDELIKLAILSGKALSYLPKHQDLSDENVALYIDKAELVDELINLYKYQKRSRPSVENIKKALLKHTKFRPEVRKKLDEALYKYQVSKLPPVHRNELVEFIIEHDLRYQ